jgi:membrane fusion protein, hemolysin D
MQRLFQRRSSEIKRGFDAADGMPPALLEFLSPAAVVSALPVPFSARSMVWIVSSLFTACAAALGVIHVDRVVTAPGRVISKAATIVVQPLETALVRSIDVREGREVRSGDLLARLDSTFATADVDALKMQVGSLQAEVSRMEAEVEERRYDYAGADPYGSLQAAIFAKRQLELNSKLEYYHQKIGALNAAVARSTAEAKALRERLTVMQTIEGMRKNLQQLQLSSRLSLLLATDNRLEIERNLSIANETAKAGTADVAAMIAEREAYIQNWRAEIAQAYSEASRKLSDAREALNKALLRHRLVELRADRDAIVLTVAKVSEGSVLHPGEPLMTLVPADAPLEIEANISGRDQGFVRVGDPVAVKFDTFPFARYGLALGTVRMISPDSFTISDQKPGRSADLAASSANIDPFFRSRITIDRVQLHDVPADFRVAPGMPVTADINVGKVTVLSYLLGRVVATASEGMREP